MSSSFMKKRNVLNVKGTKPSIQNGLPVLSSGNPSLDTVFGGGFPIGSLIFIDEDRFFNYSKVLTKYFMAEAIAQDNALIVANLEEDPIEMLKQLPVPVEEPKTNTNPFLPEPDEMRIAFRYNSLPKIDLEQKPSTSLGHYFDLSKHIDEKELKKHDIIYWGTPDTDPKEKGMFDDPKFQDLLNVIAEKSKESQFSANGIGKEKNLLRICINSIGSPVWYGPNSTKDIVKFLTLLKCILRNTLSVCMLTVPTDLLEHIDPEVMHKIMNLVDFGIGLESFAGSEKETNPAFKEYHGLLNILKISAVNTLAPFTPETRDLAFKLRRKKFVIEKLHLPPDLGEEQAEQPYADIVPTMSCGSSRRSFLDF